MTVSSTKFSIEHIGNGSVISFPYDFRILDASHLKVYIDYDELTTGFTITGVDNQNGGEVIFDTAPTIGSKILLERDVPATQEVNYQAYDAFPAETHERALDKAMMVAQQAFDGRSVRLPKPIKPNDFNPELPSDIQDKPNAIVAVNESGDGFQLSEQTVGDIFDAINAANTATSDANTAADNAYQAIADLESDGNAVISQIRSYGHNVISQLESDGQSALDALRVINVGSFEAGGTINTRNEVLLCEAEQTFYRWDGALPKTVAAASTPASTGGVGVGAWVNIGQAELASALADAADSANRVARMAITADSLKDLVNAPRIANRQYSVKGFYAGSDVGGGMFYWDATRDKTDHNGGTVIDPVRIGVWDGTQADLATLFQVGTVVGSGCFVRVHSIPLSKQELSPYWFGGIHEQESRSPIQQCVYAAEAGSVIQMIKAKLNDAIYVNKPLTLQFDGYQTELEQTSWGCPHFIIDEVSDVYVKGFCVLSYKGVRSLITSKPVSVDQNVQSVYDGVADAPGNARTLCAGFYTRFKCDNFNADHIKVIGQAVGVMMANINSDYNAYSDSWYIDVLSVDTVDFGFLSGGFKNLEIGSIIGRNITSTQGDPTHAIYVGPRTVRNGKLTIGSISVDGCHIITDASERLDASDAFSIRSTESVSIGQIQIRNAQYLGNFHDCNASVGLIRFDLTELVSGTGADESAIPMTVQSNAIVNIGNMQGRSALGWVSGAQAARLINVSGGGECYINGEFKVRMTNTSPATVAGLSSSGVAFKCKPDVTYDNEFDVAYPERAAFISNSSASGHKFTIIEPSIKGSERLFLGASANQNWEIFLNPDLVENLTENTIIDLSNKYKVKFLSTPEKPAKRSPTSGVFAVSLRAQNVIHISNSANATLINATAGATANQRYRLTCDDSFTTIQNNAQIVTKSGTDIAPGWRMFEFEVVDGVAYEVSSF